MTTRYLNFSAQAFNLAGSSDPSQIIAGAPGSLQDMLRYIPVDTGVPLDLASFGTDVIYVANVPHIGLQAVVPNGMNSDAIVESQVDGTLRSQSAESSGFAVRGVDTLLDPVFPASSAVVVAAEGAGDDRLLLVDPELVDSSEARNALIRHDFVPPPAGRPSSVTVLAGWPVYQPLAKKLEQMDLVVVTRSGGGLNVIPVNESKTRFDPTRLEGGLGELHTPSGNPQDVAGSPHTQELIVADGRAGVAVLDLRVPGGRQVEPGTETNLRLLSVTPLVLKEGSPVRSFARSVEVTTNEKGHRMAAVAGAEGGVFMLQIGPGTIVIVRVDPPLQHVCPGCARQLEAATNPPGLDIEWFLKSDLGGKATISPTGLLQILEDASSGNVEAVVRLASNPSISDSRIFSVFVPDDVQRVPLLPVLGPLSPTGAPAARDFLAANPRCRDDVIFTREGANHDVRRLQNAGIVPMQGGDGTARNAAYHALANCRFARVCGVSAAEQFWTGWENFRRPPATPGEPGLSCCSHAVMDLHNNLVGRTLSIRDPEVPCRVLVAEAFQSGRLRWMRTPPNPSCSGCREYDSGLE